MNIEHLREFVTFARFLNFSKAATFMNLAQPTLSGHIASMEAELGFKLLNRKPKIELTSAGKRFCVDSERILEEYDSTVALCKETADREKGALIFERPVAEGGIGLVFDSLLRDFRRVSPEVRISVHDGLGMSEVDALVNGYADVAVLLNDSLTTMNPVLKDKTRVIPISSDYLGPYYLWVDDSSMFASRDTVDISELQGCKFLIPSDMHYIGLQGLASVAFEQMNIKVDISYWPGSYEECIENVGPNEVMIVNETDMKNPAYSYVEGRSYVRIKGFHELIRPCFICLKDNANPALDVFEDYVLNRQVESALEE